MPEQNSLSQKFLAALVRSMPRDDFHTEFTDALVVTIPARNAEVGDITLLVDLNEITVCIGQLHHRHFNIHTHKAPTLEESEQHVAEDVANYIRDILSDRVHFQIQFEGGRCRVSNSWYEGSSEVLRRLSGVDEVREYVWSHRVK